MTATIIEDERHSAELLAHLLARHCPDVEVLEVFTDSLSGLDFLRKETPDLVFLDIEMPRLNGFDLLNQLSTLNFRIIFTTAYDKYAVRAFKYSALDYLLKPIDINELKTAIGKARHTVIPTPAQFEIFKAEKNTLHPPSRIAISTNKGLQFIDIHDIIYCKSEGSYSHIIMINNKKILLSKHLKEVEELLLLCDFMRIHHSYLVHMKHVQNYVRGEGGEVVMTDGARLPVARSKKEAFLKRIVQL